jgi:phage-related holin
MSKAIALKQFTRYFCIYTVASLFVYLLTSFTSPAGIIVIFVLLPFYSLCVASIVSTNLKNRHATVRYNKYLVLVS